MKIQKLILKLDDIANTLKDIQQPCMEKSDGGIDKKIHRLEETIEQMANDISKIKTKQTEMEEEILKTVSTRILNIRN